MTQEDKELLLKDICARLPYNAKVEITNPSTGTKIRKLDAIALGVVKGFANGYITDTVIKPYLFPLSSMTEKQKIELTCIIDSDYAQIDWYNKNHFDYRGLIPKGLALDATDLNIY